MFPLNFLNPSSGGKPLQITPQQTAPFNPEQAWQAAMMKAIDPAEQKKAAIMKALAVGGGRLANTPGNFMTGLAAAVPAASQEYVKGTDPTANNKALRDLARYQSKKALNDERKKLVQAQTSATGKRADAAAARVRNRKSHDEGMLDIRRNESDAKIKNWENLGDYRTKRTELSGKKETGIQGRHEDKHALRKKADERAGKKDERQAERLGLAKKADERAGKKDERQAERLGLAKDAARRQAEAHKTKMEGKPRNKADLEIKIERLVNQRAKMMYGRNPELLDDVEKQDIARSIGVFRTELRRRLGVESKIKHGSPKMVKHTRANPAKPMTREDVAKLPSGSIFINPATGKPMIKN
ncbi:MAG: hypothetical protein GY952_14220 [Rhodobacteraceae bacterium]|nr:hypothetical protein [Paracoccaceae bacterium]